MLVDRLSSRGFVFLTGTCLLVVSPTWFVFFIRWFSDIFIFVFCLLHLKAGSCSHDCLQRAFYLSRLSSPNHMCSDLFEFQFWIVWQILISSETVTPALNFCGPRCISSFDLYVHHRMNFFHCSRSFQWINRKCFPRSFFSKSRGCIFVWFVVWTL